MDINFQVIQNPHHVKDFKYAFNFNRWLFYILGIWFFDGHYSVKKKILNMIYKIFFVIAMLTFVASLILGSLYTSENFTELFRGLFIAMISSIATIKHIIFLVDQNQSTYFFVKQINSDWEYIFDGSRNIMRKYAKRSRAVTKVVVLSLFSCIFLFFLVPLFKKPVNIDNVLYHELPVMVHYYFFDPRVEPYYYYAYIILLFSDCAAVFTFFSLCQLITFILHACGQYEIVSALINNLKLDNSKTINETKRILTLILKKQYIAMR